VWKLEVEGEVFSMMARRFKVGVDVGVQKMF